jgi:ABC-type branched-subunit amino acid transport system ATPase component
MTPFTLIQAAFRAFPRVYALGFILFIQSGYIIVDHYIFDLTPNLNSHLFEKLEDIESKVTVIIETCKGSP